MARPRKLAVSALNVRIVDQSKRDYPALFNSILHSRRAVRVYGTDYLIMTSFRANSAESQMPYLGVIGKYTDIPDDADWLDTDTLNAADESRLDEIRIPATLKPNYQSFFCTLAPREHVFIFETYAVSKSLSVRSVVKWLARATSTPTTRRRFGDIEIDPIPDYDTLERILLSETISRIHIEIKRANPDDYDAEAFAAAEGRLRKLNAAKEDIIYVAPESEYLDLDKEVRALARVGSENGAVTARITEDEVKKRVSTTDYPIERQGFYDPDDVTNESFFRSLAISLRNAVRRNRNPRPQAGA